LQLEHQNDLDKDEADRKGLKEKVYGAEQDLQKKEEFQNKFKELQDQLNF